MMSLFNKQHLSTIWGSIHEQVKQHWDWVENNALLMKNKAFSLGYYSFPYHIKSTDNFIVFQYLILY